MERSTHWREGGASRHEALTVALPALEEGFDCQAFINSGERITVKINTEHYTAIGKIVLEVV